MGIEKPAKSSPNKLTKYQTVQGNSFYTSEPEKKNQYSGMTAHFWFNKLVLRMLHILKFNFKKLLSVF